MKEKKIFNLEDYIRNIHETFDEWNVINNTVQPWFRGQSNSQWNLVPGIYRNSIKAYEREIIRDFKLNCVKFLSSIPSNDFEWMFIMQHHSLPTRLLDWTESYLIALYFAVIDYSMNCDSCVWILHPWDLNSITINEQTVPVISHRKLKDYLLADPSQFGDITTLYKDRSRDIKAQYPVAIRPVRNTQRSIAQKGTFTIHGNQSEGLDSIFTKSKNIIPNKRIKKIEIDKTAKKKILKQLISSGISHSVLFPEIDGISMELKIKYLFL